MTYFDDDDDDLEEGVVPLGELRPSRDHFGPVPSSKPKRPQRPADGKASRQGGQPPKRPAPQQQGQARKQPPASEDNQGQRPRRPRIAGSQQPAAQPPAAGRPSRPAAQSQPEARRPQGAPSNQGKGNKSAQGRSAQARRSGSEQQEEAFLQNLADKHNPAPISAKPTTGWRGAVLKLSGGMINPGLSAQQKEELELHRRARRPVVDGTVAVFSRKGGVGKTTISAYLGLTLAAERGGRIVALDGDAEAGSLGWLLAPKAPSTLAALASADPMPSDYAQLRRFTTMTKGGLEVIVGDPAEMGPISTIGLESLADQLARHYDVSIFDTGAGVTRATGRVLVNSARVLLLVMGPSVDSVRAAERTLAWLDERPGEAVRENAQVIAVINGIPSNIKKSHIDRIENHFADKCSAVVRIPWDAHLAAGNTAVALDRLATPTRRAFVELAATTVGALARRPNRATVSGGRRVS